MSTTLSHPAAVEERLAEIENDLCERQEWLENAALAWFRVKRVRELEHARVFVTTEGSVAERNAAADIAVAELGDEVQWEAEGRWEALRSVVRTLEARANVGMALLKAQSRAAS